MKDARSGLRVKCDSRCVLVHGESTLECILQDVSISGALVRVSEDQALEFHDGKCGLCLCQDPDMCPGEIACRIVRTHQKDVGLTFVNTYVQ